MNEKDIEIMFKNNSFIKIRTNKITVKNNNVEIYDLDSFKMFFINVDEIIYYTIK